MNIFTFFCAPAASTFTANRCRHCNEDHGAPQTQGEQQLWPNYGYVVDTETFAVPVVRGVRYVQQPLQQPFQHTQHFHHPAQQPPHPSPQPPTMPHTALYTLLSLPPTAPPSTIKTTYHRLALLTHPDKNPDPDAAERFKALSAAYGILSDPKRRAIYDRYGEVAAGREAAFDEGGDLVVGEEKEGETEGEDAAGDGKKDKGGSPGGGRGRTTVDKPPRPTFEARTPFEEPVVEQSTYEERLLEALRAAHERGIEEEARRAAGRRLYERFWRGVRGHGMWGWTTRGVDDSWGVMGDPMAWRRASVVGGPMEGYRGMYDGGWAAGEVDEGLRERFRRSRAGGSGVRMGGGRGGVRGMGG
ncbi:hypothetical protein GMDG_02569 [Pseudogymnoascus destructans 20631-21]|uniref:J domain-containing protein n=1 Tax=Pseudogymnoascus destructans (strain ATCC MYA-4855 / 20631-21) TaxID=658429 RepID=L8G3M2_PSED2|nr:hypothetical protein GMDG_02569 [Pseudogymnoascus destructans 20631-21]